MAETNVLDINFAIDEDNEVSESDAHVVLIRYLVAMLEHYLDQGAWYVGQNLGVARPGVRRNKAYSPDVAVFPIGLSADERLDLGGWRIAAPDRPAPSVVFEIGSEATWQSSDLEDKPLLYGLFGVREYFAYDPRRIPSGPRLHGWQYLDGQPLAMQLDPRGWLWSAVLESWLVPDGAFLRLLDYSGQRRLKVDEEQVQRAEAERSAKERAWTKLRELGIDPASLEQ